MKVKETIQSYLVDNYPDEIEDILLADGLEEAFIGVTAGYGGITRACYDSSKCVEILMKRDGMDFGEAVEFFNFNIVGAYMGDYTPEFIFPFNKEMDS